LKILFFTQYFWPENFRINELAVFFKKQNDVSVLTCNPSYPNKENYEKFYKDKLKYKKYFGIPVIRVPVFPRKNNDFSTIINFFTFIINSFFFGLLKLSKKKFDCIFIFGTSPIFSAIPAILISIIFKKKLFLWVLDLWPDNIIELKNIKNKILINFLRKIVKIIYDNCDVIFVQTKSFKKSIEKLSKTKCVFFPSWSEDISSNKKRVFKIIKRSEHKIKIVFTGNIGESQSFDSVIKCAKLLKCKYIAKWIIVGDGRWKNNLINQIKQNRLEKDFQLIDRVELNKIHYFFNEADVLFLSLKKKKNYSKTIPGKLFTYLNSGKPILGMISGEANELIKKSKSGLVCESDDYRSLKMNIIKFSKLSSKKRKIMANNGKKFSKNNFNKLKIFKKLQNEIITNLV
tara:strand:+ start:473 stop:1678 length:1206 start_codon:yes stop_codon:yes gene_type:complete